MKERVKININEVEYPLLFIKERRNNIRMAIGKKDIILRAPKRTLQTNEELIEITKNWVSKLIVKNPKALQHLVPEERPMNYTIELGNGRQYEVNITHADRKLLSASLENEILNIKIPINVTSANKAIGKLISRILVQDNIDWVSTRVNDINNKTFEEKVNRVSMRYTSSRWGSCSNKGNISLSSRLLLAPVSILDHVIIHELAHLKEANHSPRFWAWVEKFDPNHKQADLWLKKEGKGLWY